MVAAVVVQPLEWRRMFALPPVTGGPNFAAADDRYSLSVVATSGPSVPDGLPVTGVAWGVTATTGTGGGRATMDDFQISVPSGVHSPTFLRWITTGTSINQLKVESHTADGFLRGAWTLETASLRSFGQTVAPDGTLQDELSFWTTKFTSTFRRLHNGSFIDETSVGFNGAQNTGTNTGAAAQTFASGYLATTPDVLETMELGPGQLPVANGRFLITNAGTATSPGVARAASISFDFVDGRESLALFARAVTGARAPNVVHERRDPTTGRAVQRYRLGDSTVQRYAFSDSTFDDRPRAAVGELVAARYYLQSYAYAGTDGELQSASGYGHNFMSHAGWNPVSNSAHVAQPMLTHRNTASDAVTFRFLQPIALTMSAFGFEGLSPAGVTLTSADENRTWTVGNLAAQQTSDGDYAVKLLAFAVNPATSGIDASILIGSSGEAWTLDRTGPALAAASFDYDAAPVAPYAFDFALTEPVTTSAVDGTAPILIRRADTGALVTTATARVAGDGVTLAASLGTILPDGRYVATLPAGSVRDAAGNLLAADLALPFFVLAGDADHDGTVNFADLLVLAQHYGTSGKTFAQGDFDYSGNVDFTDLLILAQRYGTSVLAAAPIAATPVANRTRRTAAVADVLQ